MNALIPIDRRPSSEDRIRVIGRVRLFNLSLEEFERPAGETLLQILEHGFCGPLPRADRMRIAVAIDGMPVSRELWHCVRPNPGRLVEVVVTPAGGPGGSGGRKSPLRLVLTLAVAAAAAWAGPALAPGLLAGLGVVGPSATLVSITGGLITGAIGPCGRLAVNANVPPVARSKP